MLAVSFREGKGKHPTMPPYLRKQGVISRGFWVALEGGIPLDSHDKKSKEGS